MAEDKRFKTSERNVKEKAIALGFNVVAVNRLGTSQLSLKEYVFTESSDVVERKLTEPTEAEKKTLVQLEAEKEKLEKLIAEAKKTENIEEKKKR